MTDLKENEFLSVRYLGEAHEELLVGLATLEPLRLWQRTADMGQPGRMIHRGFIQVPLGMMGATQEAQLRTLADALQHLRLKASREVAWALPTWKGQ